MKFSLTSMLLAVTLVAVAAGWATSYQQQEARLLSFEIEAKKKEDRATEDAGREGLLLVAHALTTAPDLEHFKLDYAILLVNEFDKLAQSSGESGERRFSYVAGDLIFRLGWNCQTPDQLATALNDFSRKTGGKRRPALPNEFLTKVLKEEAEYREVWKDFLPKESLTTELDKLD